MADKFLPATGEDIEIKAFARHFENPGDDEPNASVLYTVATLSKPDSGWRFVLVEQEGEPDLWRLLEETPTSSDGDRTYYVASGTSEKELDDVPKSIRVILADDTVRVSVVPWD